MIGLMAAVVILQLLFMALNLAVQLIRQYVDRGIQIVLIRLDMYVLA